MPTRKMHKEIQIKGVTEEGIYELFFGRQGEFYQDENTKLLLGVFGLGDYRVYQRDETGTLPKWYICSYAKYAKPLDNVIGELIFVRGFHNGVIIRFEIREGKYSQEVLAFVKKLLGRIRKVATVKILSFVSEGQGYSNVQKDRPSWFPKRQDTLEQWKRDYKLIKQCRDSYMQDYKNFDTEDPEPKPKDLVEYLANKTGRIKGERTIRNVMLAGDNGWLE